jgi:hypothetical protein
MGRFISEALTEIRNAPTKAQKINLLRHYYRELGRAFGAVFSYTYNSRYQFFADSMPPYTPDGAPLGMNPSTMFDAVGVFEYLLKNSSVDLPRKERVMINMLEGMNKNECDVFAGVFTKDLSHLGVSYELVAEAFPGMLHEVENALARTIATAKPPGPSCMEVTAMVITPEDIEALADEEEIGVPVLDIADVPMVPEAVGIPAPIVTQSPPSAVVEPPKKKEFEGVSPYTRAALKAKERLAAKAK